MVKSLESIFPKLEHISTTDLKSPIRDIEIWNYAKAKNLTIVTNDEDFLYLLMQKGFPPKVVLLKKGNLSVNQATELLESHSSSIMDLIKSENLGVLEIY